MKVLVKPSLEEAYRVLREAVRNKELIVLSAKCYVDYRGRSESRLTGGERLIIVKPDGSLLVHRPEGYKPVNWQPESNIIEVRMEGDELLLKSIRGKPREIVWIYMSNIKLLYTDKLVDTGEFTMYMDEHEIRDILYMYPEIIEEGLRIKYKEYPIGKRGYADLFGIDRHGRPVIIEIKRITASREAVLQLYGYVVEYERITGRRPRGILVAPMFSAKAIEALERMGLERREINLSKLWKLKSKTKPGEKRLKTAKLTDFLGVK